MPPRSAAPRSLVFIVAILSSLLLAGEARATGTVPAAARAFADTSDAEYSAFSVLNARDGLTNASVSGIVQDRTGFLWFGTQGGLNRYDGHTFKLFENEPFNEDCLSNNQVQTLYLDGDLLWIGTYGGLNRLDLATETFTVFRKDPERGDSLSNDVVISIVRDSRGSLWVGTLDGLNRLDEKTGLFRRFMNDPADSGSLPAKTVRALESDSKGRLWVGTSGGGLALFDHGSGKFRAYRKEEGNSASLISDFVQAIDEDSGGSLWIGSWYGGLSRFDPETGLFENHATADERVYALSAAESDHVYVGTWGGGLFDYRISAKTFTRYRAGPRAGALSNDIVYSILRDRSGELWFGTNGGGINKLSPARDSYRAYPANKDDPAALPPGKIYAVLVDASGVLWAGIYNGGLARRDSATGVWRRYRRDPADPRSLPNDIVNFIHEDRSGRLWIGTNDGLARYDRKRDDFEVFPYRKDRADWFSSEILFAMADAPDGNAWIGTFRSGLEYWDRGKNVVRHYSNDPADPRSLPDNLVFALEYDSAGKLWVGTNNGLCRLEGGGFVRYQYDGTKRGGVSGNSIRSIYRDSRGLLWIGTFGGGLMRYEAETDSFVHYTKKDGLPSNAVIRILEDDDSDLWISTQAGLVLYDRSSGEFRPLSVFNDIRNREFFQGAFRAGDGSLYFGALDMLYRFEPASYEYNSHRPPVALTGIRVMNGVKAMPLAASRIESLELGYRENSVELSFAALDFRDSAKNRFAYRLVGFDKDWVYSEGDHPASYTNLEGGRYVFRVKAANSDGLWNEEGLSLPITVGTAPWAHPAAKILYAALLAAIVYSVAVRRSRVALRSKVAELMETSDRLVAANARLEHLSLIDPLTGVPNRRKLDDYLETSFARAAREKEPIAVLMIDIDNFKAYNDRHGRQAGDDCLRRTALYLGSALERATDMVARYGGEEFFILLPNTELEGARTVAERVRLGIEALGIPHGASRTSPVVTISVGCSSARPERGQSPVILVNAADRALYLAKERGRNRVCD